MSSRHAAAARAGVGARFPQLRPEHAPPVAKITEARSGASGTASSPRPGGDDLSGQLRGRSTEIGHALLALRDAMRTGTGAVLVVDGELGSGRSAVLGEIGEQARRMGFRLRSAAAETGRGLPLAPLLLALRSTDDPLLSSDQFAALAPMPDQDVWLWERLASFLEESARRAPVAISIDDAHRLDPATASGLHLLIRWLSGSPVVWLLSVQGQSTDTAAEVLGYGNAARALQRIVLGPLPTEAITAIATDRLGGSPDARVRELLEGAAGNPFLAVALVEGVLAERNEGVIGRPHPDSAVITSPLHATFVDSVNARLSAIMGQRGSQLLQAGSALGESFTLEAAASIVGTAPGHFVSDLQIAVGTGLLFDDGERLAFRHDLVRHALYQGLPPSSRTIMHRAIADNLVAAGRPALEVSPHLLGAANVGDPQAISLLSEAAQNIAERVPCRAAQLLDGAMRLAASDEPLTGDLGRRRVEALVRAGHVADAVDLGERLLERPMPADPAARILVALAPALWASGRQDELRSRLEIAASHEGVAEITRARLLSCRALAMSRDRQGDRGRALGHQALAEATRIDDAHAMTVASWALAEAGMHDARYVDAVTHFGARRQLDGIVTADEILARLQLNDLAASAELLEQARRQSEQGCSPQWALSLSAAQAAHHLSTGSLDGTEDEAVALRREAGQVEDHPLEAFADGLLSQVAMLRGDVRQARRHLARARSAAEDPADALYLDYVAALLADGADQPMDAAAMLGNGVLGGLQAGHRWNRDWMIAAVRIGIRAGDMDLAKEAAQIAAVFADRNEPSTNAVVWAQHAQGLLTNDLDLLGRTSRRIEEMSRPITAAEILQDYGLALLRGGRRTEAVPTLDSSWRLFRNAGADGSARRVQRSLRAAGAPRGRNSLSASRPAHGWAALTPAEERVARLIAEGRTNRDAAAALVLSPHTISTHLRAVFNKLGVNTRVQLTRVVMVES